MTEPNSFTAENMQEIILNMVLEFLSNKIEFDDLSSESSEIHELREELNDVLRKIDRHLVDIDKQYKQLNKKTDQLIKRPQQRNGSSSTFEKARLTYEHMFDRCNSLARDMYQDWEAASHGRPKNIVTVQTEDLDIRYGYEGVYWTTKYSEPEPIQVTHLWRVPEAVKEPLR